MAYSNNEYTEMVRVLAMSHDNVARACNEFVKLFPKSPKPSTELMLQTTQCLRDYGQFQSNSGGMVSEDEHEDGAEVEEGDDEEDEEEEDGENEEEIEEEFKPKKELIEHTVLISPGKGFPLGHISNVEVSLSRFKTQDQKILHQYLYGQLCPDHNVTRNIKNFKGFPWAMNSTEYKAKLMETARMAPRQLRAMCEMLDLEINGGPSELATRLLGFLQQPGANYLEVSRASLKTDNRDAVTVRGQSKTRSLSPAGVAYQEEYDSDQDTKANNSKDGSEDSMGSTKTSHSEHSNSGSECEDVIGTEDREAEAKIIPDKQRPPAIYKKNAADMLVRSTKGEKASSEESYEGKESSEEEEEEREQEPSEEEDSTEESDAPANKKAKRRPTDEDIKNCVKHILEGANLEQITMKTLCKQVYSHYPNFDLAHKKDLIKSTVKSFL